MKKLFSMHLLGIACATLMNEAGEGNDLGGAAPAAGSSTRIRPDLANYQTAKSASGSSTKICGDEVSVALVGATLDEAYDFVAKVIGISDADLRNKYGDKNPGQQRMFLGNLIRGAYAGKDKEKAARVKAAFDAELAGFRKVVDGRLAQVQAAAQKAKDEKEAERKKAKDEAAAKKAAEAEARKKAAAEKAAAAPKAEAKPAAPKAPAQPK